MWTNFNGKSISSSMDKEKTIPLDNVHLLNLGKHQNPHNFLGLCALDEYQKQIRFFAPKQIEYKFEFQNGVVQANMEDKSGVYSFLVPLETTRFDYQIIYANGMKGFDPYNFSPIFSHVDDDLFAKGIHETIYEVLGSHVCEHEGVKGVRFTVWAPNAQAVCLLGDFNRWKELTHPMRKVSKQGVWELFIPACAPSQNYKYAIKTESNEWILKSDPYAHAFELRPKTASVVTCASDFIFCDEEWMDRRKHTSALDGPMNIYEMHFGSWQKNKNGNFLNYREIAAQIAPYIKKMGYTHLEIMPLTEHPLDESWGYQVTGYFAPTSRYGTMDDFQYFVNHLHMHNIGVILDWAPGHFPEDDFALSKFDGKAVYEVDDPVMCVHPEWNSLTFNYADKRVCNFLIGSALFWIDKMHIDGIRVDAVQSMMYLDYSRKEGEWTPNSEGGNENVHAIAFLKDLNHFVHKKFPGVLMIAEDASIKQGITKPVEWGGLGFDLKWNLGWMNDTLFFMQKDPVFRKHHMNEFLATFDVCFNERYILPISHDEVVHQKKTLIGKMPLDEKDQFAQLRLYYSAALSHPGKTLFFMGCELAQKGEWNQKEEVHWHLLQEAVHSQWSSYVCDVNHFYLKHRALWEIDFDKKGFDWIDYKDYNHAVISYLRRGVEETLVCVHNYTKSEFDEYIIRLPNVESIKEIFNSDEVKYGGAGNVNPSIEILKDGSGFQIKMPPLATMFFAVGFKKDEHKESV